MYTKQKIEHNDPRIPSDWDLWEILDADGCQICTVIGGDSADALLSHLNRG